MGRKVPIDRDRLAAEICLTAEELNRLMALANQLGMRVTVDAAHILRQAQINPLPVIRVSVLNRRTGR